MKVLMVFVVGAAVVTASAASAQESYKPGHSGLTVEGYENLASDVRGEGDTFMANWEKFNAAVDREVRPAVGETLSDPTRVFFHDGFGYGKDGKDGLRVVFQKDYVVGGEKRMVSVITFWTLDLATGKPVMQTGPDTVRVRAEHNDPGERFGNLQFIGLSYDTTVDGAGNITGAKPYVAAPGAKIIHQVRPGTCNGCHGGGSFRARIAPKEAPEKQRGYDEFLKWADEELTKKGRAANTREEINAAIDFKAKTLETLAGMRTDPKKFFTPPGLKAAFGGKEKAGVEEKIAAMGLLVVTGTPIRPLQAWNGEREDATNGKAPGAATTNGAASAGMYCP